MRFLLITLFYFVKTAVMDLSDYFNSHLALKIIDPTENK